MEIAEVPLYGCCVKATLEIQEGDLLFSIPHELVMSTETARSSSLGTQQISKRALLCYVLKYHYFLSSFCFTGGFISNDPILSQMPNVALAVHVLNEVYNSSSFWKPYLDALPVSYDTVMYFTPDEMMELKGSPAFGNRRALCAQCKLVN